VLSGRGLCDELITHPEESYRLWCVVVCDLENPKNAEAMTRFGSQRHSKKRKVIRLSRSLTHLICIRGLKSLPCNRDRWPPAGKWFSFVRKDNLERDCLQASCFLDKRMDIPEFLALYFFGITKSLRSGAGHIPTAFIFVDL